MKLVSIIIVWDDWELAYHQAKHIKENSLSDDIFIVYSEFSNTGEFSKFRYENIDVEFLNFEPDLSLEASVNERNKRNFALDKAREYGFTHFVMSDADEYYDPQQFLNEKEKFSNPNLIGLVCGLKCYFKLPTLSVNDSTLVPFIHKITPDLRFQFNPCYPYAFTGPKREIRIDPTRQMNINSGVEWSEITMHHYSWVRSDVQKKIRNSTARLNIEQSTIISDYRNAKPGYYCEFYRSTVEPCENLFNIPDIIDHAYTTIQKPS